MTLHESAATAVYLVKHANLGDIRVLKSIHQDDSDAKRILREADLLSGFNSPEIPTIYDVGKFNNYYYLIEEYVRGQSLNEYLFEQHKISQQKLINIAIEICGIVEKLHYELDEPVLYRDMKPEHVILTDEGVKLIDFGAAVRVSEVKRYPYYGSLSFAAKEQKNSEVMDVRCDVYGIGKVIESMMQYLPDRDKFRLNAIVKRALEEDCDKRTESVTHLKEELEALQKNEGCIGNGKEKHLAKEIAVVSNETAVGATHIAIGLTTYLNTIGIRTYYVDKKEHRVLESLYMEHPEYKKSRGVLYHKKFYGLMEYGKTVEQIKPPKGIKVLDYGNKGTYIDADMVIYVVSGSFWKSSWTVPEYVNSDNCVVISNFSTKLTALDISKRLKKRVYAYPLSIRQFEVTKNEKKLFGTMIKKEGWFE